ncbi:hypothetical protein GCE9029_01819 [Grimontia celer]|uniref:Uncharacterized protein n=1 Tax=Grimontia celer TaxID=1796497 RepID=A0A128F198_9GAMM|nr:hypothetical protein GCE9029_01819 [Grimontia celer]
MNRKLPLVFHCFIICSVLSFASLQFYKSMYRNAGIEALSNLQDYTTPNYNTISISLLAHTLASVSPASAYDYSLSAKLYQWSAYLSGSKDTDQLTTLLQKSLRLRPTWSPSYVELSSIYKERGELKLQSQMLSFARHFGPLNHSTILADIDYSYSNWDLIDESAKLHAIHNLLEIGKVWRHRPALNTTVTYSSGKQRICNLLAFNKVRIQACG